jgi:hypothetical protein
MPLPGDVRVPNPYSSFPLAAVTSIFHGSVGPLRTGAKRNSLGLNVGATTADISRLWRG